MVPTAPVQPAVPEPSTCPVDHDYQLGELVEVGVCKKKYTDLHTNRLNMNAHHHVNRRFFILNHFLISYKQKQIASTRSLTFLDISSFDLNKKTNI